MTTNLHESVINVCHVPAVHFHTPVLITYNVVPRTDYSEIVVEWNAVFQTSGVPVSSGLAVIEDEVYEDDGCDDSRHWGVPATVTRDLSDIYAVERVVRKELNVRVSCDVIAVFRGIELDSAIDALDTYDDTGCVINDDGDVIDEGDGYITYIDADGRTVHEYDYPCRSHAE